MSSKSRDPRRLRNLVQYKNMTDAEFEEAMYEEELVPEESYEDFQERIQEKYREFEKDYDLSDMKFNDTETLMSLCTALVTKSDYDKILFNLRQKEVQGGYALTLIEKFGTFISNLEKDISKMQDDLNITRKTRKKTKEESARTELDRLKELATKFYDSIMQYVYCEKCNMLLSTVWFLYLRGDNKISLTCNRQLGDDESVICGHVTEITSESLYELGGTNHPEGFKF